jgi:transposase
MPRKFSPEYKQEAVKLVVGQGLSVAQAARDLGIGKSTLDRWIAEGREQTQPDALTESERVELKRLRKENAVLRMEREILKKAAAYFAKTSVPDVSGS